MNMCMPLGFWPIARGVPWGPAPRPGCAQAHGSVPSKNNNRAPSARCSVLALGGLRSGPRIVVESPGSVPVLAQFRRLVISPCLVFILTVVSVLESEFSFWGSRSQSGSAKPPSPSRARRMFRPEPARPQGGFGSQREVSKIAMCRAEIIIDVQKKWLRCWDFRRGITPANNPRAPARCGPSRRGAPP